MPRCRKEFYFKAEKKRPAAFEEKSFPMAGADGGGNCFFGEIAQIISWSTLYDIFCSSSDYVGEQNFVLITSIVKDVHLNQ